MRGPRFAQIGLVLSLLAACVLVTCRSHTAREPSESVLLPIREEPAFISPAVMALRGQVVEATQLTGLSRGLADRTAVAVRAVYSSVAAADGRAARVSGAFFVPKGSAPTGGWPVVSFAHGTTGLTNDCGPSTHTDLLGYEQTAEGLLALGYAVAMTDYQGLGLPEVHPYLEPRTAAFNVIDAVRALRSLDSTVSQRWLAFGESQGGQAAWAANEIASSYGDGLRLLGSVALAPAANITPIVRRATTGTLTPDQRMVLPAIVVGASRSSAGVDITTMLPNLSPTELNDLIGCDNVARQSAATQVGDLQWTSGDVAQLSGILQRNALPQRELSAPMLVVNGELDMVIAPAWVDAAVSRACEMGGTIDHRTRPDEGHNDLAPDEAVFSWMSDRFAERPATTNCSQAEGG